jgi:hypothetical protein
MTLITNGDRPKACSILKMSECQVAIFGTAAIITIGGCPN